MTHHGGGHQREIASGRPPRLHMECVRILAETIILRLEMTANGLPTIGSMGAATDRESVHEALLGGDASQTAAPRVHPGIHGSCGVSWWLLKVLHGVSSVASNGMCKQAR